MKPDHSNLLRAAVTSLALWTISVGAEEAVPVTTTPVQGSVVMLTGNGGNIAVSNGADGLFVVDDQYASQYGEIRQALAAINPAAPRFLVNTHWHSDHAGGNEQMAVWGAVIVAHDNVRKRLATDQVIEFFDIDSPAPAAAALPLVTFTRDMKLHLNGDEIHVTYLANAHTDGDAIVHFTRANVIHTGDIFFNGRYPFIDAGTGGSVSGMIAAVEHILALADSETRIIPGHGPLTDRKGLEEYHKMLSSIHNTIATLMVGGNNVEQIVLAQPSAAWDPVWGNGFIKGETFVRMLVDSITRETLSP